MDFSLLIGTFLLGVVSGALIALAAMMGRPTLESREIRDLRALLAFERDSYDQLAAKVERDEADVEASRKIPWRKSA